METVKRMCLRVWREYCRCRRRHEDGSGSYRILRNHKITSEKQRQKKRSKVVPRGCFRVYVGPERQRFVIKIELANHPLFKTLLEDAENEYGFHNHGPICLPCDVDFFCEALAEMESTGFNSSVFHTPTLSQRSNKNNWAPQLFRTPRALMLKLNHL